MNLHFITSISKEYWYATAKRCINTWKLPGKVTIFIDQQHGDLNWISEIPFQKSLLHVPPLNVDGFTNTAKVRKFWGKSCSQIVAVRNREIDERIIWLDSDIEQLSPAVSATLFDFNFDAPVAVMKSGESDDCWESGLVIFNQEYGKLGQFMKFYERSWNDENVLSSLWRPYDAQVLGYASENKGFFNLCNNKCPNEFALDNTRYSGIFKHWINKNNKSILGEQK